MKLWNRKSMALLLILAGVLVGTLTGCDSSANTEDDDDEEKNGGSSITKMSKEEAKEFFLEAYGATMEASYLACMMSGDAKQVMEVGGEKQEISNLIKVDLTAGANKNGVFSILAKVTSEDRSYEQYHQGTTYYTRHGEEVIRNTQMTPVTVEGALGQNLGIIEDLKAAVEGLFEMDPKLDYDKDTVTVRAECDDFVLFSTKVLGVEEDDPELSLTAEMLKAFDFSVECTANAQGYLTAISIELKMNAEMDEQKSTVEYQYSVEFADVNSDKTVAQPDWVTAFLSNPENFADRLDRDENGNIIRYEVDTRENGQIVKTVVYNADGSVLSTVVYERDANGNILTKTVTDGSGAVTEKDVYEYDEHSQMLKQTHYVGSEIVSVNTWDPDSSYESTATYENGVLIKLWEQKGEDFYERITEYENGKPVKSETYGFSSNYTTEYYYKPDGELFCYADYSSSGYPTFYDKDGNQIPTNEINEHTYTHYEKDADGKILKEMEYNYEQKPMTTISYEYDASGKKAKATKTDRHGTVEWVETYSAGVLAKKEIYFNGAVDKIYEYNEAGICVKQTNISFDGSQYVQEYHPETGKLTKTYSYFLSGAYYLSFYDDEERMIRQEYWNADGMLKDYSVTQYEADGITSRTDKYNADGVLQEYIIRKDYADGRWEATRYKPDGSVISEDSSDNYGSGG